MRVEIGRHLFGSLLHAGCDALNGLVDVGLLDLDLLGLGRLDLEHLVDQVAKHLLAKRIDLIGRNLVAIGDGEEREALVDIGLGDHVAVHDRRRLDHRRHGRPEHLRVLRQVQRLGALDRLGLLVGLLLLGGGAGRKSQEDGRAGA